MKIPLSQRVREALQKRLIVEVTFSPEKKERDFTEIPYRSKYNAQLKDVPFGPLREEKIQQEMANTFFGLMCPS